MFYEEMMERMRRSSLNELISEFSNYVRWCHYTPGRDPDDCDWLAFVGEHFEAEIRERIQFRELE